MDIEWYPMLILIFRRDPLSRLISISRQQLFDRVLDYLTALRKGMII